MFFKKHLKILNYHQFVNHENKIIKLINRLISFELFKFKNGKARQKN